MPREMNEEQEQQLAGAESEPAMVAAMFAGSQDEAERCRDLLKENGIPATVGELGEGPRRRSAGIPLLVPEPLLENASEILSARTDDTEEADGVEASADDDEDIDDDLDDDYDDEDELEAEDEEAWDEDDDETEEEEDFE